MRFHLALMTCLIGPVALHAQNNLGYLNSMEIIYVMPEMKDVQKKLTDYSAELDEEFKKMTEGYRKLEADYKANAAKWSETIRQLKEDELLQEQQKIQRSQEAFQQDLSEKQQLLLEPLLMKADSVIKLVAKEKNLQYVFDTSKNALLFAEEGGDISKFVKMKLGIDPNAKPQGME
ncbi:MAG: OmpH family outer membrane protein [Bacteroidetes bacterium]|nr:OmpH family outer membrane protein [Bacteroidota bacterium]